MSKYWGGKDYTGAIPEEDDAPPQVPVKIPKKRYTFKSAKIWKRITNEAQRHFAVDSDYKLVVVQSYRLGKEARISRRSRRRAAQHSVSSV